MFQPCVKPEPCTRPIHSSPPIINLLFKNRALRVTVLLPEMEKTEHQCRDAQHYFEQKI